MIATILLSIGIGAPALVLHLLVFGLAGGAWNRGERAFASVGPILLLSLDCLVIGAGMRYGW